MALFLNPCENHETHKAHTWQEPAVPPEHGNRLWRCNGVPCPGHETNVFLVIHTPAHGTERALVYASCTCGWNGDAFRRSSNAELQGRNHADAPTEDI